MMIVASFGAARIFRKPIVWGMPLTYSIEPTNFCNLKCPECPSGTGELTRPLGFLAIDIFKKIINEISETGFYVQLFFHLMVWMKRAIRIIELVEHSSKLMKRYRCLSKLKKN